MIKSVTIDFHTEKSISIISDARLEAILVSVSENTTDIIVSNISFKTVEEIKLLFKGHKALKIVDLPRGDIVVKVENKQITQTVIKHHL
jgi:hypothetical protein